MTSTSKIGCLEFPQPGFVTHQRITRMKRNCGIMLEPSRRHWDCSSMLVHMASLCKRKALASAITNAYKHSQSHSCVKCWSLCKQMCTCNLQNMVCNRCSSQQFVVGLMCNNFDQLHQVPVEWHSKIDSSNEGMPMSKHSKHTGVSYHASLAV